jgi:hypothetical protein
MGNQFRPPGGFMSGDRKFNSGAYEMKNLLLAFTLLGVSIASAKTYSITLTSPAAIGNSQLKSGEYKLELKGDSVLVKDGRMVNEFPVHVENEARNSRKRASPPLPREGRTAFKRSISAARPSSWYSATRVREQPASGHPATGRNKCSISRDY